MAFGRSKCTGNDGTFVKNHGSRGLALSANAPLLQRWFASSSHPLAGDPFFLYAASNVGSLLGLLAYPLAMEPLLPLGQQSLAWTAGYLVVLLATGVSGAAVWNARSTAVRTTEEAQPRQLVTSARRVRWVLLALVPSSLMLSVTTYMTTDIAPVPLLWVIPLALYLLSFVVVFAGRSPVSVRWASPALIVFGMPLLLVIALRQTTPPYLLIALHLLTFFIAALVCHGQLAESRPDAKSLTDFYLWISVGGVIGGVFTTLAAPVLFRTTFEYPLVLLAAFLLRPDRRLRSASPWRDYVGTAMVVGGVIPLLVTVLAPVLSAVQWKSLAILATLFGSLGVFAAVTWRRAGYPAVAAAAVVLTGIAIDSQNPSQLHVERNFFGVKLVQNTPDGAFRQFLHGSTVHGVQALARARRMDPTGYYDRTGPLGDVFASPEMKRAGLQVAVLGLGTGGMSCYATRGQQWTFYEIDPAVERIARDPRFFTFLRDCDPRTRVTIGDARLSLAVEPDGKYDIIALDVFSSDAIPVHLLTREALDAYGRKLSPSGLLLFHISNRYLDLAPVLGALTRAVGLHAVIRRDGDRKYGEWPAGKHPSNWVAASWDQNVLRRVSEQNDSQWRPLPSQPRTQAWTDDFSNVLAAIRW